MQIIPVIDLKDGLVVHAVRGERSHYQPVHCHSALTENSEIAAVLACFLKLYPFKIFYIADLNAITGKGNHNQLIAALLAQHPDITFWIDNGALIYDIETHHPGNYKTVIGSESQQTPPDHRSKTGNRDFILSLDFNRQQALGHADWFTDSRLWPQEVIVMTLSRVGSQTGPDFEKLGELSNAYPHKNFIAAGGIRHSRDLIRLAEIGVDAALIATALHCETLSGEEIMEIQTKKYPGMPGYF